MWSHAWRVWARSTSFYIKPRDRRIGHYKISLHGIDPRHPEPGWKLGFDGEPRRDHLVVGDRAKSAQWYPGAAVAENVSLVLRIRIPWFSMSRSVPNGVSGRPLKSGHVGHLVPAPALWYSTDVDIYVSDGEPYWPNPQTIARDNAGMGPLANTAGQILTAVNVHQSVADSPLPVGVDTFAPRRGERVVRGIYAGIPVGERFPWIVETPMAASAFDAKGPIWGREVDPVLLHNGPSSGVGHLCM